MDKRKMRKLISLLLILVLAFTFTSACSKNEDANAGADSENTADGTAYETQNVRVHCVYTEDTLSGKAFQFFKEELEARSGGKISVELFLGGILGADNEATLAQKEGSLELLQSGTNGIGVYVPSSALTELFYSYVDIENLDAVMDDIAPILDEAMAAEGFKYLGCFVDGPRHFLLNDKVEKMADMKGLQIRCPGSPVYIKPVEALGATAVSMAFNDIYTSMQSGAISGFEGTVDSILTQKFYEVGKYLILDSHVYLPYYLTWNLAQWESMNETNRTLIEETLQDTMDFYMEKYLEQSEAQLDELSQFVEFVEIKDRDQWVETCKPVNEAIASEYGEYGKAIWEIIQKYQK